MITVNITTVAKNTIMLLSRRSRQRERLSASELSICLSVSLSVSLSVCLSPKCKKAIFSKTKQFTATVSYWQPIGSRTLAFQRTYHGTPKIQDGGDPSSWILTPKRKNAIFFQKLSNLELWCLLTTDRKLCNLNWAFQRAHYWIPTIQDGWDPPSWKSTWRHFFLPRVVRFG